MGGVALTHDREVISGARRVPGSVCYNLPITHATAHSCLRSERVGRSVESLEVHVTPPILTYRPVCDKGSEKAAVPPVTDRGHQ